MGARGAAIQGLMPFAVRCDLLHETGGRGSLTLEMDKLLAFAKAHGDSPVLVYGFTYILWEYFVKPLISDSVSLGMPNVHILHSGGWKRLQDEAVDKKSFNHGLAQVFGCSADRVIDFYGMVENVGVIYPDCAEGNKHVPAFGDVIVRDPLTLEPVGSREAGMIQVCSVLPTSFPGHLLLTEDLAEIVTATAVAVADAAPVSVLLVACPSPSCEAAATSSQAERQPANTASDAPMNDLIQHIDTPEEFTAAGLRNFAGRRCECDHSQRVSTSSRHGPMPWAHLRWLPSQALLSCVFGCDATRLEPIITRELGRELDWQWMRGRAGPTQGLPCRHGWPLARREHRDSTNSLDDLCLAGRKRMPGAHSQRTPGPDPPANRKAWCKATTIAFSPGGFACSSSTTSVWTFMSHGASGRRGDDLGWRGSGNGNSFAAVSALGAAGRIWAQNFGGGNGRCFLVRSFSPGGVVPSHRARCLAVRSAGLLLASSSLSRKKGGPICRRLRAGPQSGVRNGKPNSSPGDDPGCLDVGHMPGSRHLVAGRCRQQRHVPHGSGMDDSPGTGVGNSPADSGKDSDRPGSGRPRRYGCEVRRQCADLGARHRRSGSEAKLAAGGEPEVWTASSNWGACMSSRHPWDGVDLIRPMVRMVRHVRSVQ